MKVQIKDNQIYAPLKDKWLVLTAEEEKRQQYITRLAEEYGYDVSQMEQGVKGTNSQRGQGPAMADIVIWKSEKDKLENESPAIVVECKAEYITVRKEDYFQGYNYASRSGADFFVTTNLKETRIFKVVKGEDELEEIINIPKADIINNATKVEILLKQTKVFTRDAFSKLLFKCHNIIRNNDKLSPEAAFDEISKILFIKIRFERNNSKAQIFSKDRYDIERTNYEKFKLKDGAEFYQFLFEQTKEDFKNDDLFETSEIIRIRENSFEAIVEELEKHNLSTTSDDVKGIAFEQFLGRTFRGELGQFFTPRTIVDFIVEVLDPQEGEILCDPCCGSGGFLIKSFEYVRSKIELDIREAKEKIKVRNFDEAFEKASDKKKAIISEKVNSQLAKLNYELDINNDNSRLRTLSYDCIFGTDANPRMSRTAKMNMIMHGDGHGGVHHNDGLLNVNGVFENRFDLIITNPPFGSRVEKSLKITEADKYTNQERIAKYQERYGNAYNKALAQINNNIGKPLLNLFETGKMSTLTEVLFIERCLNLLKPGGRMGIVLPEGVLNNTNLQKVRDFVESRAKIILITSIPQDVFIASGATVKPSLLFFKKFTDEENQQWSEISNKAEKEIKDKYYSQTQPIEAQLKLRGKEAPSSTVKKELRKELKALFGKIETEIKAQIKMEFDYQIPIAEVEKAGISTTGSEIENELIPLCEEFTEYRKKNKLWENKFDEIMYDVQDDGSMFRIPRVGEPQEIYGKK